MEKTYSTKLKLTPYQRYRGLMNEIALPVSALLEGVMIPNTKRLETEVISEPKEESIFLSVKALWQGLRGK